MVRIVYLITGAVIAVLGGLWYLSGQEPVVYREIVVKKIQGEPVVERTFVDRIVYREREPELVAEQPGGADEVVEAFCKPDTVLVEIEGEAVYVPADTVFLMRSVRTDPGYFFSRDKIYVYGPTSVGDLLEVRYESYPGWSIRTQPDLLFREPRLGWLGKIVETSLYVGIGFLGGKIF